MSSFLYFNKIYLLAVVIGKPGFILSAILTADAREVDGVVVFVDDPRDVNLLADPRRKERELHLGPFVCLFVCLSVCLSAQNFCVFLRNCLSD